MPVPDTYKPSDTDPPSSYLRARDYTKGDKWNLVISDVSIEEMKDRNDPDKPGRKRLILVFQGREKGLVLNSTNKAFLEEELGDRPNTWIGATIMLNVGVAPFQGKMVPSFSIRSATPAITKEREVGEDDL